MRYVIYTGVLFMPNGNAAAQRANSFSEMLKKIGYIPVIIGMNPEGDSDSILSSKTADNGVLYYYMNYPKTTSEWLKMLVDHRQIVSVVESLGVENVQAIIAIDYYAIALGRLVRYCKRRNINFIADAVDWFERSMYQFPKNILKDADTYYRMNCLYKKIDNMIAISEYLSTYYKPYVKKIVKIPGVYCDLNTTREKFEGNDIITLAFVGSPGNKCEKEKIDWVIKAICKINDEEARIRLIVAGIDKKTLEVNRPDLTSIKGFDESVLCLGRLKHEECINLIRKSDFSIIIREDTLLSRAGFPTKLGESFACGTPVFVTPTSDICSYIPAGYGIISENCTYEAVETSLIEISSFSKNDIMKMHDLVSEDNALHYAKFLCRLKEIVN